MLFEFRRRRAFCGTRKLPTDTSTISRPKITFAFSQHDAISRQQKLALQARIWE